MIKLTKNKSKAFAIRCWWTNYIYWIPTIQTELHKIKDSCLTNLSIGTKRFKGNNFSTVFKIFGIVITIDYWWELKQR